MENAPQRGTATRIAPRLAAVLIAGLVLACTTPDDPDQSPQITPPPANTTVRPAAIGQQWVYLVRNLYNHQIVDEVTETVVATTPEIRVQRVSQRSGILADEIHATWGQIVQDSHWNYPITFSRPLPAWPPRFDPGRTTIYSDRYQMLAEPNYSAQWNLAMTPRKWVSIRVPAGSFTVLQFDNLIHFQNDDLSVVASERMESVWFSPEIGRWVLRRSRGTYFLGGRGGDFHEDYLQWELKSWS